MSPVVDSCSLFTIAGSSFCSLQIGVEVKLALFVSMLLGTCKLDTREGQQI